MLTPGDRQGTTTTPFEFSGVDASVDLHRESIASTGIERGRHYTTARSGRRIPVAHDFSLRRRAECEQPRGTSLRLRITHLPVLQYFGVSDRFTVGGGMSAFLRVGLDGRSYPSPSAVATQSEVNVAVRSPSPQARSSPIGSRLARMRRRRLAATTEGSDGRRLHSLGWRGRRPSDAGRFLASGIRSIALW